ncbi:hypothetical protein N0V88_005155 [Collariella sp. IMI 366227]|nr:hypothetical protein N0V88_005155 [Collariella sp. IMI 366227]
MAWTAPKIPLPELIEDSDHLDKKARQLANLIKKSKHFIVFTGAGISTSAGIPDFRGPEGAWTLEAQGRQRTTATVSTMQAIPTLTHMALVELQNQGVMKYLISQNCDGLHRRSGILPDKISELHGNSNREHCKACGKEYIRAQDFDAVAPYTRSIRDHRTGRKCAVCTAPLHDSIINFTEDLPERELNLAFEHAGKADLCLVLGSSLTVTPANEIPEAVGSRRRRGAKLVICNLQDTPLDGMAELRVHGPTDEGMMYLLAPIVYCTLRKFPSLRKACTIGGFIIAMISLLGASFANTVPQLLATQGVLYALGGSLHYFPAYLYLDEWFVRRRGLAYGVFIAGAGAAGIIVPLTMEWILHTWGFRTALRVWVVVSILLTTPVFFALKPRLPDQHADRGPNKLGYGFLKSSAFWVLLAGNVAQTFAVAQGWSALSGTIAVSLCSAATAIGATLTGWLVDRYHVTTVLNFCTIGTVVAVFVFWSFAVYQPILYIFALLYGMFAGGFPATWSGCTSAVRKQYAVENGMVIAMFTAGKGIGCVISGPVSGALVASDTWKNTVGYAYGSGYGYLIVFSGITASFASIGWFGKKCGIV